MRFFLSVSLFLALFLPSDGVAQVTTEKNVKDAWRQGGFKSIRLFYGYSSSETGDDAAGYYCRVDYFHDGRIRLLAINSWIGVPDVRVKKISVSYWLEPINIGHHRGNKLLTEAYQYLAGPDIIVEPVIPENDLFVKRCVPHLGELFEQIPEPEVKMFKEQYGTVFGIE